MTNSAAWQHEYEAIVTTTRWDKYPLQVIDWFMASGTDDTVNMREGVHMLLCHIMHHMMAMNIAFTYFLTKSFKSL